MLIAFSGTRVPSADLEWQIENLLIALPKTDNWVVGDAPGVDEIVRNMARLFRIPCSVFSVEGTQPQQWQFAQRTKKMISALSPGDKLIAFPNKKCPDGCYPSANPQASGSGTWLAIAYATHKQITTEIHGYDQPEHWQQVKQLTLF